MATTRWSARTSCPKPGLGPIPPVFITGVSAVTLTASFFAAVISASPSVVPPGVVAGPFAASITGTVVGSIVGTASGAPSLETRFDPEAAVLKAFSEVNPFQAAVVEDAAAHCWGVVIASIGPRRVVAAT